MGKVFVLREPRKGNREWNFYALREAARLKRWFDGVYYSPRLHRLLAVFRPTPGTHVNMLVFEEIGESILADAYRMECPKGCNRCCVIHSGAFILDVEVRMLPDEVKSVVLRQPRETIITPGGKVRVYRLDTEAMGRCIFFDVESGECKLEVYGKHLKPVVCLLTYCTVFASKDNRLFLKSGYKELRSGGVLIYYREVNEKQWKRMVDRMGLVWKKYRKVVRSQRVGTEALR